MTNEHPRILKGAMMMARKDGPDTPAGALFTNTYMGGKLNEVPEYWPKLHEMIYSAGRLRKYAEIVEDIVEKFSFVAIARDQVREIEARRDREKRFFVKYHTYTYIFMMKSFLDACAVFLNETYGLNQRGSSISLEREKFLIELEKLNSPLTEQLRDRALWLKNVVRYRNNLIHRHGLYVGPIPKIPESLIDPLEVDKYIMAQPTYMPNDPDFVVDKIYQGIEGEFILVTALVDEWVDSAYEIFNLVLSSFTLSFEVYDPNT